jgi:hypothetical protein
MANELFRISQIRGTETTQVSIRDLSAIEQVLMRFATNLIKDTQQNLQKQNINTSRNSLSQSIAPLPIKKNNDEWMLEIEMNEYWKFVNEGVQGAIDNRKAPTSPFKYRNKMPPREAFINYITDKPINPGGKRGARLKPRESLAGFMQVMTYRYGIKRTEFFDKALTPAMQKALIEDVAEALGKTISISMKL